MTTNSSLAFKYGKNLTSATDFQKGTIFLDIENNELFYDDPSKETGSHQKIIDSDIYNIKYEFLISNGTQIGIFYNSKGEKTNVYVPQLSGGTVATNDTTLVGGVTVSGHAITVAKKNIVAGNNNITISGNTNAITISSKDTVNTTGSTDNINDKLYIIGAKEQAESPVTYSNIYAYISSNHLHSNDIQVVNLSDKQDLTNKTYNGYTLGPACEKEFTDSTSPKAISNVEDNLATERDIYYGLPYINNSHTYTSGTTIYAPTDGGISDYLLKANGKTSTPTWENPDNIEVGKAKTATALTSNAGSSTKPIYFISGKPKICDDSLAVNITGNAATATKLATARTISLTGSVTGSGSFDGSGNLTIETTTNHNHNYLSKSGGTLTGALTLPSNKYNYHTDNTSYVLNCSNSDIIGVNGIYFSDACDGMTEGIHFYRSATTWDTIAANSGVFYFASNHTSSQSTLVGDATIRAGKVYGAVWNDYAEFRKYKDGNQIPYGRVVIENGDDSLSLSTQRMQKGGNICSDTFGFAIGETEETQMPIAVSGRVLAYTNEDRNSYEPGDAVCTGPNGTISKMTREEIKEYPDRIIGYVSAIPEYEIWGEQNITVDGRIWIKVV